MNTYIFRRWTNETVEAKTEMEAREILREKYGNEAGEFGLSTIQKDLFVKGDQG